MSCITGRLLPVLALALGIARGTARAQDSASITPRAQSFAGSARVALDAQYTRPGYPGYSQTQASATFAPFVADDWQVGIAPAAQFVTSAGGTQQFVGAAALIINYLPFNGSRSRPYVGAYLAEGGQSATQGYGTFGLQAGWLHFLTPAVALRAEFRFLRYSSGGDPRESDDLLITFDPYLFGRATRSLTSIPSFGVFDATIAGDFELRPAHVLSISGTVAPFLNRALQTGITGDLLVAFDHNTGDHQLEWFTRGYLPVDRRVLPFADGFVARSYNPDNRIGGSHGARAGVRTYLTPGVALDLAMEWRNFSSTVVGSTSVLPPEQRSVRVALMTQFRAIRARD